MLLSFCSVGPGMNARGWAVLNLFESAAVLVKTRLPVIVIVRSFYCTSAQWGKKICTSVVGLCAEIKSGDGYRRKGDTVDWFRGALAYGTAPSYHREP